MTEPFSLVPPASLRPDRPRPRLEAQLTAAAAPVRVLLAPGGYGKTCALRAFWSRLEGARAWLTIPAGGAPGAALELAATAAAGGWLVLDGVELLSVSGARAVAAAVVAAAPGTSIVLAGRHGAALPLAQWRSQGLLAAPDGHALALDASEWEAAGLAGPRDAWGGWWGARLAAARPESGWDPELAAWLGAAWLDALDDTRLGELGRVALLGAATPALLSVLARHASGGEPVLAGLAAEPGPLLVEGECVRLAPRLRPYVTAAWRARQPERFAATVSQAVPALLDRAEPEAAAEVAIQAGGPGLQRVVLERAGWHLLLRRDRHLVRALLDARPSGDPEASGLAELVDLAWQVLAEQRPHVADARLLARLPGLAGQERALGLALSAAIGWQYDDYPRLATAADEALAILENDLHPAAGVARLARASGLAVAGRLVEAEVALGRVLACAVRDALPRAQLTVWHRLAAVAAERDDGDALARALAEGRRVAEAAGLSGVPEIDSLARLAAYRALAVLDAAAARAALAAGDPDASRYGGDESFPHHAVRAALALVEDDDAALAGEVAWMEAELTRRFLCLKWRADALVPRVALRARRADAAGLRRLAAEVEREAWPASLHAERRAVLVAGARLLAGDVPTADALEALAARALGRRAAGCLTVARAAELVVALVRGDADALLAHIQEAARGASHLDYLWLAPRCVGPLEALLSRPELVHDATTRNFLRALVQRLLEPVPVAPTAAGDAARPRPAPAGALPADMTAREWEILQLIGQQLTNEQIAARLFVSVTTVKTHINHVYGKLGITTRAEAVLRARTLRCTT